ncbi:MAG: DUF421 domain-containing protein [Clostridia bacterium]|nr:DUF421 domain-containing protein [Clostridia bacterium]
MPTTIIRTVLLYLLTVAAMKIMGKRQIGQMQLSELVTVTILSELVSYSILDTDIPIIYSIAPVFILICLEVSISFFSVKSRLVSRLFDGKPSFIIYKGKINRKEMVTSRLTLTEVISEIRASGFNSVSEIYYMILEPSGKISVIPRISKQPLTPADANIRIAESGIDHGIIIDGKIIKNALSVVGKSNKWLDAVLRSNNIDSFDDVFYLAVDDNDRVTVIKKTDAPEEIQ